MLLFSGLSNIPLAKSIAHYLDLPLSLAKVEQFPDGETNIEILSDVSQQSVVIIQSLSRSANHHIMELLLFAHALRKNGATHITALIPYFAYARQESDFLIALAKTAGIQALFTLTPHHPESMRIVPLPLHQLETTSIFADDIEKRSFENPVIIAPDHGSIHRARSLRIGQDSENFIAFNKKEDLSKQAVALKLQQKIFHRDCIMIDDIVDTGKTLCQTARLLKTHGARQIHAYATHGVLSHQALENISTVGINSLTLTDSLLLPEKIKIHPNIRILSVAPLLAKALEEKF
jgi:ribose-phosphate pyrophosphokinase